LSENCSFAKLNSAKISSLKVLRRIIGKTVAKVLKQEVTDSVGSLQVCVDQDAG